MNGKKTLNLQIHVPYSYLTYFMKWQLQIMFMAISSLKYILVLLLGNQPFLGLPTSPTICKLPTSPLLTLSLSFFQVGIVTFIKIMLRVNRNRKEPKN